MSFRDWTELESDPGLFTLLVYDFGVKDVEVEEVYDLAKPFERCVYGFIFLFKWTEERKSRRKAVLPEENFVLDENTETDMFFAQQIIPNSCASHALLSVLLNVPEVNLGYTLKQLRDSCKGFDAETKGHAIGNFWNIAIAHYNHGRPELRCQSNNLKNVTAASRSLEAFHYVSYIPYRGKLFELDGLKPHPIDHGPWSPEESWSDKARQVIQDRIQLATGGEYCHDIRYNLLAVVPEKRYEYKEKTDILNHNKKVLIELFKKLADKESFANDRDASSHFKHAEVNHPFGRVGSASKKKRASLDGRKSPLESSCSSTMSGNESPSHPFSDSEDSSIETYRIKSIMRGKMKPAVYVFGENSSNNLGEEQIKTDEKPLLSANVTNDPTAITDSKLASAVQITDVKQEDDNTKRIKLTIKLNPGQEINSDTIKASLLSKFSELPNESLMKASSICTKIPEQYKDNTMENCEDAYSSLKISFPNITKSNSSVVSNMDNNLTNQSSDIVLKEDVLAASSIAIADFESSGSSKPSNDVKDSEEFIQCEEGENEGGHQPMKQESESSQPGLGVEIIADDADIDSLLDQNKLEKLSLSHLLKYEDKIKLPDLQKCMQDLDETYKSCEASYKEELEKIENYKIDDCRRRHNYDPFISTFLSMLADQGHLAKLLEQQNTVIRRVANTYTKGSNGVKKDGIKKKKRRKIIKTINNKKK